jgi:hypothetical protein
MRLRGTAQVQVDLPQILERTTVMRVEIERFVVVRQRQVVGAEPTIGKAHKTVGIVVSVTSLDHFAHAVEHSLPVCTMKCRHAGGVIGIVGQHTWTFIATQNR